MTAGVLRHGRVSLQADLTAVVSVEPDARSGPAEAGPYKSRRLLGAEFTWVFAHRQGSRQDAHASRDGVALRTSRPRAS